MSYSYWFVFINDLNKLCTEWWGCSLKNEQVFQKNISEPSCKKYIPSTAIVLRSCQSWWADILHNYSKQQLQYFHTPKSTNIEFLFLFFFFGKMASTSITSNAAARSVPFNEQKQESIILQVNALSLKPIQIS